jgi:hypothetical protein
MQYNQLLRIYTGNLVHFKLKWFLLYFRCQIKPLHTLNVVDATCKNLAMDYLAKNAVSLLCELMLLSKLGFQLQMQGGL